MTTIHQIVIYSPISTEYKTTITLSKIKDLVFYLSIVTEHCGIINEFEERYDTYKEALNEYLSNVNEYANHTALMNL